jgi:hypothetical protein
VSLAFPLTRLRLSTCLRRSLSITRVESSARLQLHLQHDSLVDDQSTMHPADFKFSCVHVLNQLRPIACRSTHPSGMRHVFPHWQKSDTISRHAPGSLSPIFTVFCIRQTVQSNLAEPVRLQSCSTSRLISTNIVAHYLALFWYMIIHDALHFITIYQPSCRTSCKLRNKQQNYLPSSFPDF